MEPEPPVVDAGQPTAGAAPRQQFVLSEPSSVEHAAEEVSVDSLGMPNQEARGNGDEVAQPGVALGLAPGNTRIQGGYNSGLPPGQVPPGTPEEALRRAEASRRRVEEQNEGLRRQLQANWQGTKRLRGLQYSETEV